MYHRRRTRPLDPIPFAYGTQLLGTTTVYLDAGLQVGSLVKLTISAVTDVGFRAERRKDRICSDIQYRKSFERLEQLPRTVEHLIVQLGTLVPSIPVVATMNERLGQGFPSLTLGWFSWRARLTPSSILWSTSAGRALSAFLGSSTSSTQRLSCWMTW